MSRLLLKLRTPLVMMTLFNYMHKATVQENEEMQGTVASNFETCEDNGDNQDVAAETNTLYHESIEDSEDSESNEDNDDEYDYYSEYDSEIEDNAFVDFDTNSNHNTNDEQIEYDNYEFRDTDQLPVHPNIECSVADALKMIEAYRIRHNLNWKAVEDLGLLLNTILGVHSTLINRIFTFI